MVHVMDGIEFPDEVQEMLTLSLSESISGTLVPASVLGNTLIKKT